MANIDFLSILHKSTARDYMGRVNDSEFPKERAATLAKQWGYDYWDGDRRINYGGYRYIPGRWTPVAEKMVDYYQLADGDKILDIGCGKGFQLYEFSLLNQKFQLTGVDISTYAIENAHPEIKDRLLHGCASRLPFSDKEFDFVFSLNTLHNLSNRNLDSALREIERVGKRKYICVESYRSELEKKNLLYWQVTCEQFNNIDDWEWWFENSNYTGDYSFIFFE